MGGFNGVELDDLVLTTERLTLRPWAPADAPAVHAAMQDRTMHVHLNLPDPYSLEDAVTYVTELGDEGRRDGTGLGCAVVDTNSGRLIGSVALRLPKPHSTAAELGYWVVGDARGRGYAAEATRRLADWAHAHGVARVQLRCATTNRASASAAMRAGFTCEAVLRDEGPTPAGPVDHAVFVRFPGDRAPAIPRWPALDRLSDGVITLRPLSGADADAMVEQEQDALSKRWAFTDAEPDEAQIRRLTARAPFDWLVGNSLRFALLDWGTGRFAGNLDVRLFGPPGVGLIGYSVHPAWRGRGYTARALRLVTPWLFEHGGFARLELGAKINNVASQKAARAGGYLDEGVHVRRLRNPDGSYSDEARFYLINPRT